MRKLLSSRVIWAAVRDTSGRKPNLKVAILFLTQSLAHSWCSVEMT